MCGICGIVEPGGGVDEKAILAMMKIMKHRGPDDEDHLVGDELGLGHVRLSIIDLSPKGRQPMPNDDKNLWIVYNGEIYNYIELRTELETHGFKFSSNSDTEVLLKAYEHWGKDCLPNLRQETDGFWREREDASSRIPFPTNVFVVGTVNVDETTYMFSPKVLDRANVIEFRMDAGELEGFRRQFIAYLPIAIGQNYCQFMD